MQVEFVIGYILVLTDFIGLILSILVLLALAIPLKGSTRSCLYAAGSVISFFIGGIVGVVMFSIPHPPSPFYVIGWHNYLGVFFGYVFLCLAIFQYRDDQISRLSIE